MAQPSQLAEAKSYFEVKNKAHQYDGLKIFWLLI